MIKHDEICKQVSERIKGICIDCNEKCKDDFWRCYTCEMIKQNKLPANLRANLVESSTLVENIRVSEVSRRIVGVCVDCNKKCKDNFVRCYTCEMVKQNKLPQRTIGICITCNKKCNNGFTECYTCHTKKVWS